MDRLLVLRRLRRGGDGAADLRRVDAEMPTLPGADPRRPRLLLLLEPWRGAGAHEHAEAEGIVTTPDTTTSQPCAWCDGRLPAPIETLAVVHGPDGRMLVTCGTTCLAELVAALAGPVDGLRHLRGRWN
jgi:hypothetical protein